MISLQERFWKKVSIPTDPTDCWIWTACKLPRGYGKIKVNGKIKLAHRVSFQLNVKPIPEDLDVLHSCDTPSCVNFKHLFLGTHADNIADRVSKGRSSGGSFPGEKNSFSKLTEEKIKRIRNLYSSGKFSQIALAEQFNVGQQNISCIVNQKTWNHNNGAT